MFETIFYSVILLCIFIFLVKMKSSVLGLWLFGSFLMVSFFSILLSIEDTFADKDVYNIAILPYFLLIVAYLIYSFPFLFSKDEFNALKVDIDLKKFYMCFAIVYIVCSIIVIYSSIPVVSFLLEYADWDVAYREDTLVRYSNAIEYYSILLTNYSRILAFIVGFLLLRKKFNSHFSVIVGVILILMSSITQIFSAIVSTSRSMIFEMLILMPAIYFFFCRQYSKRINFIGWILIVIIFFCSLYFFVDVTISRFEGRGTYDSVISYFGQAPIVFNTQMYGLIDPFLYGEYTLGKLFSNSNIAPASIGGLWDARFYTFVGWLYIDWGGVGIVVLGVALGCLFFFFIKKRKYAVSDLFLLFSYYSFLLKGIFVIGRAYIITIVSTLIIYLFLKFFVDVVSIEQKK